MEAMLSQLGMGTRYCLVSDDHERPETYADDQQRLPQTAFERLTDLDSVYEKFSRPAQSTSREAELGRTLAGGGRSPPGLSHSLTHATGGKENTAPRAPGAAAAADTVLALFDKLAQRHSRSEITAFDRRFPLARRGCQAGSRVHEAQSLDEHFSWSETHRHAPDEDEWTPSRPAPVSSFVYTDTPPQWSQQASAASPPPQATPTALPAHRAEATGADQTLLIDLS